MLIASAPAFAAGIIEDLTKKVGVRERLLATMLSGLIACLITGYSLTRSGLPVVDNLLSFLPLSIAFTAFAVGGFANAINIIDGFNGLAGGVLMICFGVFGLIAFQVGDMQLVNLSFLFLVCMAGFMLLNFPFGKIFMGDGGAYFMGFMLAWIGVMLPMRNHEVSPWASIVVCAYPIIETLFSIYRKIHRKGHHPGRPDSVHFHMLVYQRCSRALFFGKKGSLVNGLTTLFILPYALFCSLLGFMFYANTLLLVMALVGCSVVYYLIYLRLTQFRWCIKPINNHFKGCKANIENMLKG
jgi:UDP-N-acetylmuramyl pentapeptide phosphotransferase/UDP-N-acetylglucosamine-1-phosphate transferase